MQKYAVNHPEEFLNPAVAWSMGFMQMFASILNEMSCIFYLASIDNPIDVIIRFIALGSISKIDSFYSASLPSTLNVKRNKGVLEFKNFRRTLNRSEQNWTIRVLHVFYKVNRMMYASFIFYFMPFSTLFVPYMLSSETTPI